MGKIKATVAIIIVVAVIVLVVALLSARFILGGPEDTWICNSESGQWVKHGNPSAAMPTAPCGNRNNQGVENSAVASDAVSSTAATATSVQIANPASIYCKNNGGQLEIRKDSSGGDVGYCVFANNSECEEWAFMRGECKPAI